MDTASFIAIQLVRFVQALVIAWALAYALTRVFRLPVRRWLRRLSSAWTGPLAAGLLAAAVAAGISWARPPLPGAHDEFSYLLAADTFAHGRLTNPSHPLWQHFETLHEIQQPTYASKYPPGQGLILAFGQVVAGNPAVGLWFSVGAAAAAVAWMLAGWMPRRWALLGGVLVGLHPGIQLVWTQSYWGGNVAFLGGAVVLGACRRLQREARGRDALGLAVGLAVLANSRPFEGALVSVPVAVGILMWITRTGPVRPAAVLRVVLPLGAALAVTAGWMAYYNWRVTGNACRMPYVVHEETYGAAPFFLWQAAGPLPEYRHDKIARLHRWLRATHRYQRSWPGFVGEKWVALFNLWYFFLGLALSVPLAALPWLLHSRRYWLPVAMALAGWFALLVTTWANPHYFAPAGPAVLLIVVQGFRHLRVRLRRRGSGRSLLVPVLLLAQAVGFVQYAWFHVRQGSDEFASRRAEMVRQLHALPGRHLVLVRYGPDSNIHHEWVFNEADIDAARIVWARSIKLAADRRLLEYFRERRVWWLEADTEPPQLVPQPRSTESASFEQAPPGPADRTPGARKTGTKSPSARQPAPRDAPGRGEQSDRGSSPARRRTD